MKMKLAILALFSLLPALCTSSHHEFIDATRHCKSTSQTCEIRLESRQYQISHTVVLSDFTNLTIIGDKESTICFDTTNQTHLHIEHVYNVSIQNVRFMSCKHEPEGDTKSTDSYLTAVNSSVGVFIDSCSVVQILDSDFSNFYGSLLTVNYSRTVSISNCRFEGSDRFLYTQGITYSTPYVGRPTLLVRDCVFLNLSAVPHPNVLYDVQLLIRDPHYLRGAGAYLLLYNYEGVSVEFERCMFHRCSSVSGGAIFVKLNHSRSSLKVRNSNFTENSAKASEDLFIVKGGAISIITLRSGHLDLALENCVFRSNRAFEGTGGAISKQVYQTSNTTLSILTSTFVDNYAHSGGAITASGPLSHNVLPYDSDHLDQICISSSNFELNHATHGGAFFVSSHSLTLNSNNNFTENRASFYGGVFFLLNAHLNFQGSNLIARNHAKISGGVAYLKESNLVISHFNQTTHMEHNRANIWGGAIYVEENFPIHLHTINSFQLQTKCFIRHDRTRLPSINKIIFRNNSAANHTSKSYACHGNDIYIRTMRYCSDKTDSNASLSLGATIRLLETYGLKLDSPKCSISTGASRILLTIDSMCKVRFTEGSPEFNCDQNIDESAFQDYFHDLREFLKSVKPEGNQTISLVFPGYFSKIKVYLEDDFNHRTNYSFYTSVRTPSDTNGMAVSPVEMRYPPSRIYNSDDTFDVTFIHQNNTNQLAEFCVSSIGYDIENCSTLLIAKCPPGFQIYANFCIPQSSSNSKKIFQKVFHNLANRIFYPDGTRHIPHVAEVHIPANFLFIISRENNTSEFVPGECKSFKCNRSTKRSTVNLLKPYEQCKPNLTGPYCTECTGNGTRLLIPPVSLLRIFNDNNSCYSCNLSQIWIPLYFLITVIITTLILALRIDIFNDYTRSIAFYSSILYLYVVSCGPMNGAPIYDVLSGLLSVGNLLVTQNLPFCISEAREQIRLVTLFDNWSPFIYYFYLVVVYFLFEKIPCLQRYNLGRNIHFPMWTLFILTYSNLCVGVFVPFQCNNQGMWIYNGTLDCNELNSLNVSSLVVATIIVPIPILLILLSYRSKEKRLHLTENYEKRYRPGFRLWEVMKLFCRFIIALIFPLQFTLPVHIKHIAPLDPCLAVSLICLLLLAVNSISQPATNHLANHYESFCLFILSVLGIVRVTSDDAVNTGLLLLSPYLLFFVIKLFHPTLNVISVASRHLKKRNRKN